MTSNEFARLVNEFIAEEEKILGFKAADYANGSADRLSNFRQVGDFVSVRPSIIALTYMLKHMQAIAAAVKGGVAAEKWCWMRDNNAEGLKQRIADLRNYALLLAACIDEEVSCSQETYHFPLAMDAPIGFTA